ncbi:hypothetical protein D3C73_1341460 [compost metagenome]
MLPLLENDFSLRKPCDANFRTLQIGQYCHETTMFGSQLTHQPGTSNVIFSLPMGEVQAHDINARFHQSLEGFE